MMSYLKSFWSTTSIYIYDEIPQMFLINHKYLHVLWDTSNLPILPQVFTSMMSYLKSF